MAAISRWSLKRGGIDLRPVSTLLKHKTIRFLLVVALVLGGYTAYARLTAPGRIASALEVELARGGYADIAVRLSFKPEQFHINLFQQLGTVRGVRGGRSADWAGAGGRRETAGPLLLDPTYRSAFRRPWRNGLTRGISLGTGTMPLWLIERRTPRHERSADSRQGKPRPLRYREAQDSTGPRDPKGWLCFHLRDRFFDH